jgi:hypothetical protein
MSLPVEVTLTLPSTANSRREMTSDLRGTREQWRGDCQGWREGEHISSRAAISTNIVLIGSKLSALGSDTLEVLLGWSIRIANLKEEAFFANWLSMELSDDLLADIAALETSTPS